MQKMNVYPNPWGIHPRELEPRKRVEVKGEKPRPERIPAYVSLDAKARPCGACFLDVNNHAKRHAYVGAKLDAKRTVQFGPRDELRAPQQDTVYLFLGVSPEEPDFASKLAKQEPVAIPVTEYYMDALRKGHLLPADELSSRYAGYKIENHEELFGKLHQLARRWFDANRSEFIPSFDEFEKSRFEAERLRVGKEEDAKAEVEKKVDESTSDSEARKKADESEARKKAESTSGRAPGSAPAPTSGGTL